MNTTNPSSPLFSAVDWSAELNVEERISSVPEWVTIKGLFFQSLQKEAARHQLSVADANHYVAFKDYPIAGYFRLLVELASKLYPEVSLREGLRRLGRTVAPSLLHSMIGRVVFGALGGNVKAALKLLPKGYAISARSGKVIVSDITDEQALIHFENFYGFYDCYHVGVVEGFFLVCGKTPEVRLRLLKPGEPEMLCSWQ